jgi:hypothetical protein
MCPIISPKEVLKNALHDECDRCRVPRPTGRCAGAMRTARCAVPLESSCRYPVRLCRLNCGRHLHRSPLIAVILAALVTPPSVCTGSLALRALLKLDLE